MTRTIEIDGKPVTFKASAAVLRNYRIKFRRDLLADMAKLSDSVEKANKANKAKATENAEYVLSVFDLTMFENIAYIMARLADPKAVPDSVDDWLDGFNMFSIYEIMPQITELWGENMESIAEAKKGAAPPAAR